MDQISAHVRAPKQDRSRASYERVIEAAIQLLAQRGADDFTLVEVSTLAKVSIGSIYGRFTSKEDLIRTVHYIVLQRVDLDRDAALARLDRDHHSLATLIPAMIRESGNLLRSHAAVLSALMTRAAVDPVIMAHGKQGHAATMQMFVALMLKFSSEITHPNPKHATEACFMISYSTIARYLGLETAPAAAGEGNWNDLIHDLGIMCLQFLRSDG